MARMTPDELRQYVYDFAGGCGIEPAIAVAQLDRESVHFAPSVVYGPATGTSGEKGIAQFMKATWARFGSGPHDNAYDPALALPAYCSYMTLLIGMFGGSYELALQGYNGGEGNVQRGTVSARARRYATEVIAAAQSLSPGAGSGSPIVVAPESGQGSEIPTLLIVAGLGLGGLILWAALSD